MADLQAICEAIKTALEAEITGLHVYTETEQVTAPAVQIEPNEVDYTDGAMGRGLERWDITVRLLLSTATERSSKRQLWEFFGQTKDIKDAIEKHTALHDGTAAHAAFVRRAGDFGIWDAGGVSYRGGEFHVDVYA